MCEDFKLQPHAHCTHFSVQMFEIVTDFCTYFQKIGINTNYYSQYPNLRTVMLIQGLFSSQICITVLNYTAGA